MVKLTKNIWIRGIIIAIILVAGILFLQSYNQIEKPGLISTEGRSFEKAVVVEVLRIIYKKMAVVLETKLYC